MDFKTKRLIQAIVTLVFTFSLIAVIGMKGFLPKDSYDTAVFAMIVSGIATFAMLGHTIYTIYRNKKFEENMQRYVDVDVRRATFTALQTKIDYQKQIAAESAPSKKKKEKLEKELQFVKESRETAEKMIALKKEREAAENKKSEAAEEIPAESEDPESTTTE